MIMVVGLVKSTISCDESQINKGVITLPGQIWQKGALRSCERSGRPSRELLIPSGIRTNRIRRTNLISFSRLKLRSSYLEKFTPKKLLNLVIQSCMVPSGHIYPHQALLITRKNNIKLRNPIIKALPLKPNRDAQVLCSWC